MSKDLPINLDNTNDIYRRQASLGGNKITRSVDNTEGNTTLVWGRVTQVYYQKGTCDFKIQGQSNIFVDNSGSDGTLSAPIPVDYYGKNYDGHPFIKTRLIQKGNKVLVAFVNGSTANPVIIGVYPDNSESYELLSPALDNKISDNTEDTNYRVNNELEITPANQMIYKSGDGSWAKSMQGRSFLIVQGNKNFELEKISSCYENIPYFYKDNASDEPVNYPTPVYSENTKAPEWLLVHEGNWELDGSSDKHRTRFYVNQEGELQIVFFTLDKPEELLVVDGNKDTGFTIMKQFDSDTPMDKNSKNYVKFNVGDNNEISMSVSPSTDSKEQAQSLEIKSDGIYVNGKLLTSLVGGNQGDSDINVDDVKDIINSTTGIEDWDKFKDTVHKAAQDAQQAADEAKKAGDEADAAGQDAAQAGLDAKLAGENAAQKVSDLKDKMLYYLSLSPEKDMYVPGKYLILNEDVTIKNGFIKEGYIDDAAINSASIKDAAITSAKIKDLAVYSAKIANAAITNAKIADLSVGTAKIRDLAVTDEKVGKLTFNHMIGETLDANLINVTNLTADSIKAHSITADKITIGSLGELSPNLGNITGGSIDAGNVNIDNLPADDPNILTPDKKVKLRNTVDTLQEAVKAQNDFQNSVGAPSDTCNTLNMNMSKLIADTTPLLRDMHSNSEYDHKLIDNDIDNVNIELNNLSHKAITTIGKTADGKNTIYTGAFAPSNPHIGDIWAKPSDDGSNEGTFEIYGQNGWFSPTKDVYNRVQSQVNNLPKSYYQGNEPTGDIATGSIWYKTKQDAMGNVSFDMYVYQDGKWVAYNDSSIEGLNAKINQVAQTADGKNKVFSSDTQPNNANVHEGDLWFNTKNNSIYVYHGGTWTVPNASAQAQIDSAISKLNNNYYQANQPTGNIKNGDMWYKTITNSNGQVSYELYVYQNGNWLPYTSDAINDLQHQLDEVAKTADGKNAVFASGSAPSNPAQGDIWIDTSDNNAIKVYINGSWQTTESQNQNVQDQVNNALNGIPKVYYQSTQPTGTINEGSTWYKTGDNNTYTMYTYKNGQWVGLLDDNINTAVSDATNTINNTINSNVNNLNNSINDVKDDIDNLNFGGRNLLLQSQARDNGAYYAINGTKQNETFLGANVYEQHSTWQGQEFKLQNLVDRNVINTNDEYVFSTYVKYTGKNPGNMIYFFNADNTIQILNGENGQTAFANTKPNVWNQISIHIKFNSTTPPSSGKFYAGFEYGSNNDHSVTTYWACPKLEKGSKATDYSIAPEDVDSSLSDNKNAINQTNSNVTNVSNKVGQVQNSVNTANNNISSLQGNVNTINQQLKDQQSQLKGLSTINYIPNSGMITDISRNLAQTGQKPLLWKEYGNAAMRIADWGGQPSYMHLYNDWGNHSVVLSNDYSDCIINGWVDENTGNTVVSNNQSYVLINRLITVVPGDTIHLYNQNQEKLTSSYNSIAWYDKDKNFISAINIPGINGESYSQDIIIPYGVYFAKIGMVGVPKDTKNTWSITYNFKNMYSENIISNNPIATSSNWTKIGNGSGTLSQVSLDSGVTPSSNNVGMQMVNTWNNYQNSGMRTNLSGLSSGKVYTISFYVRATNGGSSIRLYTPNHTAIQIIPNNSNSWTPMQFSFIANDTNQFLDLYFDGPNSTVQITGIKISCSDSNADKLTPTIGTALPTNWGSTDSVGLSDKTMFGEHIIDIGPDSNGNHKLWINNSFIENRVYVAKMWVKSDSGSNTLHLENYGGFYHKNVNVGTSWSYVEFPFVFSSSTSVASNQQNGSSRNLYIANLGPTSWVHIAGLAVYDYDTDVRIDGYYDDNNFLEIDASSAKFGATGPTDSYVRILRNKTPNIYPTNSRGTTVTKFDLQGTLLEQKTYDTYATNNCNDLVTYLNNQNSNDTIIAITTCDANTLDSGLQTWLEGHGVPSNLIQTYNQARYRMVYIGTATNQFNIVNPIFVLDNNGTKYQQNTFGGSGMSRVYHYNTKDSHCFKLKTYPISPNSWTEYTMSSGMDFCNMIFIKDSTATIQDTFKDTGVRTVSMYTLDQEAFTFMSSWNQTGIHNEPFDIAPHITTATIPIVTSTHSSRIQSSITGSYMDNTSIMLEVSDNKYFDNSTKVPFNSSGGTSVLQNYLIDGYTSDYGWSKPVRVAFTLPMSGSPFGNNSNISYIVGNSTELVPVINATDMLTVTQSTIDYIPQYQPNTTGFTNNSVQLNQSYNGVTIDDKDGITINAGNNRISLNANVGIDIWGNSQHNMKLDTNGNLIMRGNLVAGNISGVTFSGNAMQLQTGLAISGNGAITVGNDVSISASQGLVMNKGSININNNTLITNDGTLITKKLLLNNSAQILNKESGRPVITLDNNGNATFAGNLNVVNINGNNGNLNGVLNVKGGIKSNGVYLSNEGLSVTNGSISLGTNTTLLAAPGKVDILDGWLNNGSWQSTGRYSNHSNQDCGYQYVPIQGNAMITIVLGNVPDLRRNQLAWYDNTKSFISQVTNSDFRGGAQTVSLTSPSNARYLSFSTYVGPNNSSQLAPIYIYQGGRANTILTADGTLLAQSAVINGTVTSNNVNITGGSINLVKPDGNVAFRVDSTGKAVFSGDLSSVNIMGNNSTLSGMLAVNGTISAASGNVIMNNDGLTINKGSINIGNGNGTTFMVKSDGTLLANNATITGDLTARKLTIASNADVSINVNGQFTVDRDGNVYAGSLTLKNGTINSSNMYGSSIIGSTLKLADTYLNEFYDTQLSRTQYDEYGLRSGYTLKGVNMNRHGVVTHAAGVRERSMNYLAMALSGQGWLDDSGNVHSSTTDIYTLSIQQLLALNDVLHIRFTNGPSNVFTNGGTRRIIFYDSNNNVISSYESGSNSIDVTPPPNATGFKLCVYVGNNGYNNWLNAIRYSELTNTGNYMDTEDSVIAWQGDSSNPGYDICSFNYGTTDASQLNVTRDNMWITALQFDSSQLSDGDIIKLEMEINYDNSYYKPGGQFWLSVNGKSMNDSNPYFGSTNLKYAVVGNYKYIWYFTYHSDLGNHIILNLNMQGMQSGSRFYITDTKEVLHSTRNPNYYGTNNITEGAMNVITQDGKIRQTYDIYQTDGNIINSRMRDVQQSNGYFTLQAQSRLYNTNNNTINEGYNDFSAIYMSGDGLSFVGDFNKHYVEPFMYSGALTASSDDKWQGGAAITLWGNISHETLLEHDFQYELGSGLVIDIWGNFHLMYSSVSWNVNNTRGVAMLSLDQRYNDIMMGNMFGANVPGVNPNDYSNGNNHIFKFEGSNGHITLGRMWMSTFGDPSVGDVSYVNANVSFNLVGDGWFCFQKGIATYDGTVHTISDKNTKYDIELLDNRKSIQAIQNTDFARFHYKSQHNRAESYQKGVIIDNSNEYSVDNSFVDDNGKTLNIMNLVATLADVVKEQQKQISELNAKVAYLEINK